MLDAMKNDGKNVLICRRNYNIICNVFESELIEGNSGFLTSLFSIFDTGLQLQFVAQTTC